MASLQHLEAHFSEQLWARKRVLIVFSCYVQLAKWPKMAMPGCMRILLDVIREQHYNQSCKLFHICTSFTTLKFQLYKRNWCLCKSCRIQLAACCCIFLNMAGFVFMTGIPDCCSIFQLQPYPKWYRQLLLSLAISIDFLERWNLCGAVPAILSMCELWNRLLEMPSKIHLYR